MERKASEVRLYLGMLFATFLTVNAIGSVISVINGLKTEQTFTPLPSDTAPAVRLVVFVIGLAISWFVGRMLFRYLIKGEIPLGDSTNIAYVLLFYLLLLFASVAFLGVLYWFLFPFFFVLLLIISVIALWELLGAGFTIGAVGLALLAGFLTFYLLG
jgi:hypothetical protein